MNVALPTSVPTSAAVPTYCFGVGWVGTSIPIATALNDEPTTNINVVPCSEEEDPCEVLVRDIMMTSKDNGASFRASCREWEKFLALVLHYRLSSPCAARWQPSCVDDGGLCIVGAVGHFNVSRGELETPRDDRVSKQLWHDDDFDHDGFDDIPGVSPYHSGGGHNDMIERLGTTLKYMMRDGAVTAVHHSRVDRLIHVRSLLRPLPSHSPPQSSPPHAEEYALFVPFASTLQQELLFLSCELAAEVVPVPSCYKGREISVTWTGTEGERETSGWVMRFRANDDCLTSFASGIHISMRAQQSGSPSMSGALSSGGRRHLTAVRVFLVTIHFGASDIFLQAPSFLRQSIDVNYCETPGWEAFLQHQGNSLREKFQPRRLASASSWDVVAGVVLLVRLWVQASPPLRRFATHFNPLTMSATDGNEEQQERRAERWNITVENLAVAMTLYALHCLELETPISGAVGDVLTWFVRVAAFYGNDDLRRHSAEAPGHCCFRWGRQIIDFSTPALPVARSSGPQQQQAAPHDVPKTFLPELLILSSNDEGNTSTVLRCSWESDEVLALHREWRELFENTSARGCWSGGLQRLLKQWHFAVTSIRGQRCCSGEVDSASGEVCQRPAATTWEWRQAKATELMFVCLRCRGVLQGKSRLRSTMLHTVLHYCKDNGLFFGHAAMKVLAYPDTPASTGS